MILSVVEEWCKTHNSSVMDANSMRREGMMKDLETPLPPLLPRKRKLITYPIDDADEADSHPPPPQCRIIPIPTPPRNPPATEVVPPQAPPQAPTPPRAPTPPAADP